MLKAALSLFLCTASCLCASAAKAQVASDGTVNTQVDRNGNVTEITGGETRGGNLFHSFQDFSVPTNNEAFFNNADNIANIFSRVTGGNISNIDGIIRANGSASLFLINPAGIIFGENARLDLGGSFFGSTASSIVFEDGNFSAIDNLEQPTLTVNAPIGLGFRDEPGEIVNRSFVQNQVGEFAGLEVSSGQTLGLIGGNISFEAGEATAPGGNIYLGGLAEAGTVDLNEDGSLNLPEDSTLSNITLTNAASVDVRGMGGGNITIDAQNLSLAAGESGSSSIRGGIAADSTSQEAQAGNIIINVVENTSLNDSRIVNQVDTEGVGSSGNISLNTDSLALTNGGSIDASTFGSGNAGAVSVTATEDITAEGENSRGFSSGITSQVIPGAEGNSGGVTISTTNLSLAGSGLVAASTGGQGDAGAVSVTATGDITAEGENSEGFPSSIASAVNPGAEGDAGGVAISTNNLSLINGGQVDATTFGSGDAGAVSVTATGDITAEGENSRGFPSGITSVVNLGAEGDAGGVTISTTNLSLAGGGQVDASTRGQGDAGAVSITATGNITAEGVNSRGITSSITSGVNPGVEGNAGGITISTANLSLTDGARIAASTAGQGNAGAVSVTATGDITAEGLNSRGITSGITSLVGIGAEGDAGGVTISTTNLNLTNGGQVDVSTGGQGNAGDIDIDASNSIFLSGVKDFQAGISADAVIENGNGGDVNISTGRLEIINNGIIKASNFDFADNFIPGTGLPGNITIDADTLDLDGGTIGAATQSTQGVRANIDLNIADRITLKDDSFISAQAFNEANGGNLTIDTDFVIAFPEGDNDIIASAEQGRGGNIIIGAESLLGIEERSLNPNTNDINASSEITGLEGTVRLIVPDIDPVPGSIELPTNIVVPEQTTAQICQSSQATAARGGLTVSGKGGVPSIPESPLDSDNIYLDAQTNSVSTTPQLVTTSQGKIQPARGIEIAPDGTLVLTAYRTNNAGDRLPETKLNCS